MPDRNAVGYDTMSGANSQALLYPVEGQCGSLRCAPYVNNRELTCAVCSQ